MSVLALAAAAVGAYVWLGPDEIPRVHTAAVIESTDGAAGQVLNASGYVTARNRATVSSKITGKLVEVRVEEGLAVVAGQLLARLDDSQYRASLALAESRLGASRRSLEETRVQIELAELTLERTRRLAPQQGGLKFFIVPNTAGQTVNKVLKRCAHCDFEISRLVHITADRKYF